MKLGSLQAAKSHRCDSLREYQLGSRSGKTLSPERSAIITISITRLALTDNALAATLADPIWLNRWVA
jgi:hypothetical protein